MNPVNFRWNRSLFFWSTVLVLMPGLGSAVDADMLWLKKVEEPVSGLVIREDASAIVFRYRVGDEEKTVEVERERIQQLIVTIDQDLLHRLEPTELGMYLDYAEELSAFQTDDYAMELSKRLCLITARWSQADLRRSAFRLLIDLCDGKERRRLRRLAFIYDPTIEMQSVSETEGNVSQDSKDNVIELIRMVWKGRSGEVSLRLQSKQTLEMVEFVLDRYSETCRMDEFLAAIEAEQLSVTQLARLLRLQRLLSHNEPVSMKENGQLEQSNWADSANQLELVQSTLPEFENVLAFDPSLTIYRDGQWIAR